MKHYDVALARAKEFSIARNEPVMIAKAKNKNDYVILLDREPTKNYEIIETVEIINNFDCRLLDNDRCKLVIEKECDGLLCHMYNTCYWCKSYAKKTKNCDNCKNNLAD